MKRLLIGTTIAALPASAFAQTSDVNGGSVALGLLMLLVLFALYWTPSIIAGVRKHRQVVPIVVLNCLLGWTGLGWIGALVWSLTSPEVPQTIIVQQAPAAAPPPPAPTPPAEPAVAAPAPVAHPPAAEA